MLSERRDRRHQFAARDAATQPLRPNRLEPARHAPHVTQDLVAVERVSLDQHES
jgi:hypothetical protein